VAYAFKFNEEKNQLLKATRWVSFEDVLKILKNKELLDSQKHPNQKAYIIKIKEYVYFVPYVVDVEKQEIFLKTIYPSRKLTKFYWRRGKNEKKN